MYFRYQPDIKIFEKLQTEKGVDKSMLEICLLGTSGMMPLPGRWLTSLMARYNGSSILIDCGEGTQISIKEKGWSFHDIDVICFTHYHGDHISGLPGLLLSMGNADRKEPVTMIGPKGLERVVNALRIIAPELPFPILFHELAEPKESIPQNGFTIEAFRVNHNVTCYGYNIEVPRAGRFLPEKAEKNQVPKQLWSRLQKGAELDYEGRHYTQDMILGPKRRGIKLTYCTDSRPCASIAEAASHADLFICEGMYGQKEKQQKAIEYKHMTFYEAAELAKQAEVSELWLTHYSPSLVRPELFLSETCKIFEHTKIGRDHKSIVLEFEKDE